MVWNVALYAAETLMQSDRNKLEAFECGSGEGWRKSVGWIKRHVLRKFYVWF